MPLVDDASIDLCDWPEFLFLQGELEAQPRKADLERRTPLMFPRAQPQFWVDGASYLN